MLDARCVGAQIVGGGIAEAGLLLFLVADSSGTFMRSPAISTSASAAMPVNMRFKPV